MTLYMFCDLNSEVRHLHDDINNLREVQVQWHPGGW